MAGHYLSRYGRSEAMYMYHFNIILPINSAGGKPQARYAAADYEVLHPHLLMPQILVLPKNIYKSVEMCGTGACVSRSVF